MARLLHLVPQKGVLGVFGEGSKKGAFATWQADGDCPGSAGVQGQGPQRWWWWWGKGRVLLSLGVTLWPSVEVFPGWLCGFKSGKG